MMHGEQHATSLCGEAIVAHDIQQVRAEALTAELLLQVQFKEVDDRQRLLSDEAEGREALLARLRQHLAEAQADVSEVMPYMPLTVVSVRAVPDFLQSSAPSAFYNAAPANGSAPAQFEINLADMTAWRA